MPASQQYAGMRTLAAAKGVKKTAAMMMMRVAVMNRLEDWVRQSREDNTDQSDNPGTASIMGVQLGYFQRVRYLVREQARVPSVLSGAAGGCQVPEGSKAASSVRDGCAVVALVPRRPLTLVARLGHRPEKHIVPQPDQPAADDMLSSERTISRVKIGELLHCDSCV